MSYHSYSLGQDLLQQAGANLTSTQTSGSTTGGGTVLDAATVRHMQAVIAQRAGATSALATPRTAFSLAAPLQPVTGQHTTVSLSPEAMAALGPPRPGAAGTLPGSGGGSGDGGGASPEAFAAACAAEQGVIIGPMRCKKPDGAVVTWDAQLGRAVCVNAVGECAGTKKGSALMIGAAALAALMLLR